MREKRSTHREMLVMGSRDGAGVRPLGMSSSTVTSDMSIKSSSKILFTTFRDSETAGLNGPLPLRFDPRAREAVDCGV